MGGGPAAGQGSGMGGGTAAGQGSGMGGGPAAGHGSAQCGGLFPGNGMPAGNRLESGGPPAGSSFGAGLALGSNLWGRSFAFSLGPPDASGNGQPQAPGSAPATSGSQTPGTALAFSGGQTPGSASAAGGGHSLDPASAPVAGQPHGAAPAMDDAPGSLSGWTVWGLGDVQNFSGGEGASRYDGEWRTAYLGADRRFGERWLGGVALARGRGEAGYAFDGPAAGAGRLRTELTAVYPYARGLLSNGAELWAMLGAGTGDAIVERDSSEGDPYRGGLSMRLAAAGLRHSLRQWSAVQLSVLADAGAAALDTGGEHALAQLDSTAYRARLGLEMAVAGSFSPYLRVNARYDGGGELADAGYEGEAGLRYSGVRVDFDLRGRWMAMLGDAGYRESGAAATFTIKAADDGAGLFAMLTPSWGSPGATDFVWGQAAMPAFAGAAHLPGADPGLMFNAELGYGIDSWRLRGRITPMLGYGRAAPGADTLQLGAAYAANPEWMRRELTIGLGLQRQQSLEGPAWGAELRIAMRW